MKVINLGEKNSLLNTFVAQMRDKKIQKDSMRFRKNLERVGNIFAYEISQTMNHSIKEVETPLGIANMQTCDSKVVVASILRAGLPLHEGILNFFDEAQNAFVAAYRKPVSERNCNSLFLFSVGQVACISQTRNYIRAACQLFVDCCYPESYILLEKVFLKIFHGISA